ncbi:MAG: tRNA pseudouridine(55) synthase TruB [Lactimicrobium sp.]|jgi:tRNA pseudouridine55 synthase|uniref:tRNA pseudouridine(55) synthase TruB n=1 Tax=Lactimicrobium sp. TaxID=2563780 RepID=UPI002F35D0AB
MDAVLLLNKPAGMTSFAAVRKCRSLMQEKKAGHTGTLDPNAQGLMIVLLGRYTKLAPYCICNHKHYIAEFVFGKQTDTQDIWGNILQESAPRPVSQAQLDEACIPFTGDILQVPPMYSAIKINGQKLVDLARRGREVERAPRPVHISSLSVTKVKDNLYQMDAVVSSGTYIRTLIQDYCHALGQIGTMTSLRRVSIENINLDQAADFDCLEKGIVSPLQVIDPAWLQVDGSPYEKEIRCGKPLQLDVSSSRIMLCSHDDVLAAYEKKEDGLYHCQRGLF